MASPAGQIENKKYWLGVAMWMVGVGITILAGYTSVTLTRGAQQQELINLKAQVEAVQKQLDYQRDHHVSRDVLDATLKGMADEQARQGRLLESIQNDVRRNR